MLGTVTSTLSGASTYPQHVEAAVTEGESNGQVKAAATTYLVQLRRVGGSPGDVVAAHNVYLEAEWS